MTAKEKEGFDKLAEEAEITVDKKIHKKEISEVQEFRKEHLYNGTKKMKHILPKTK